MFIIQIWNGCLAFEGKKHARTTLSVLHAWSVTLIETSWINKCTGKKQLMWHDSILERVNGNSPRSLKSTLHRYQCPPDIDRMGEGKGGWRGYPVLLPRAKSNHLSMWHSLCTNDFRCVEKEIDVVDLVNMDNTTLKMLYKAQGTEYISSFLNLSCLL